MRRKYYYLVSGLQDIVLDIHKLNLSQFGIKEEIRNHVHPDDYALVEKLFLPYDHSNLLHLLQKSGKPFDDRGNHPKETLEAWIKEPEGLPSYLQDFIISFKQNEPVFPGLSPENELTTLFFEEMLRQKNSFLRAWHRFELNVRNIQNALSGRKHMVAIESQIIGYDEISETIRRSHAKDFGLSGDLEYMEALIEISRIEDAQEREKLTDQLRWDYLDELTFFEYFTIERIMAYVIKLGLVERWLAIDTGEGNALFQRLLKDLQSSFQLPETFTEK